ncbi:uncharacterized protein [Musca autumnalis]|uniref:uncharacterized protein n=1 Tax=Musca autumnalis TaxID=221902 RepID=UPI003CF50D1D
MESAQLAQLLEAINTMATAMKNQQASSKTSTSVNIITNYDQFEPTKESFKTYKERLELHLQLKGVFDDKITSAKLLLQYIGSSIYSTLATLAAPRNISDLSYDDIIQLLSTHFCPKKNVLVEQHRFLCEVQNENQNISEFVAVLQQRSNSCKFECECKKSVAEIFLRSQFIRGLRDTHIREQLLQTPNASFKEIVDKATTMEAAKLDSQAISHNTPSSTEINQLHQSRQKKNRSRSQHRSKSATRINYGELGLEGMCLRCGRSNHIANECKVKKSMLKCRECGKSGHVRQSISAISCLTLKAVQVDLTEHTP